MENITNEIKAKVFAPYIRSVNIQYKDSRNRTVTNILLGNHIDEILMGEMNVLDLPKKLILKPFQALQMKMR